MMTAGWLLFTIIPKNRSIPKRKRLCLFLLLFPSLRFFSQGGWIVNGERASKQASNEAGGYRGIKDTQQRRKSKREDPFHDPLVCYGSTHLLCQLRSTEYRGIQEEESFLFQEKKHV
jgi:hypothetical protein